MSRIGKLPITVVPGVTVRLESGLVLVEGPKGKLQSRLPLGVNVNLDGGRVLVTSDTNVALNAVALQGVVRTCLYNMVKGVSSGFSKDLDIVGVGYRAAAKGNTLTLTIGYSHPVEYEVPAGIAVRVENNTKVIVSGADKVLVGMVADKIRGFRCPEPYQGKGIRYSNEHIIRKQGKAAGSK